MEFGYTPRFFVNPESGKQKIVYRPEIPIRISHNHHLYPVSFLALLDSGSDCNLFPIEYAQEMGVLTGRSKKIIITGIGNSIVTAYRHPVSIFISDKEIHTPVNFCQNQKIPLLGRNDFFVFFSQIIFRENDKKIILT